MEQSRPEAQNIDPDIREIFDDYRQGIISRREFLSRMEAFAIGAVAVAASLEGLGINTAKAAEPGQDEFMAQLQKWFAVRSPVKQHEVLNRLAGDWNVLMRFNGGDQVYESHCTSSAQVIHGGRFLLEQIAGEISAPDESNGAMRIEPFSATRILGYDVYKKAYAGIFIDNQNTCLLSYAGHSLSGELPRTLELFGLQDEPMMDLHDAMMKYELKFADDGTHTWSVFLAAGGADRALFEYVYSR